MLMNRMLLMAISSKKILVLGWAPPAGCLTFTTLAPQTSAPRLLAISNSTGNFSLGPPVLLCSEYMKMKISDLVMFAEVDLVSMYPDSASAHDKKE